MKFIYPKLRKHILVVPFQNKVSIGNTLQSAIEVEDDSGVISEILLLCDGTKTTKEIFNIVFSKGFKIKEKDVVDIIDQISEFPYIFEDGNYNCEFINDDILERYSRNLNFLSNFDKKGNKKYDYLFKIINSSILVLGLGGVGSPLIYDLAALGFGKIIAVDFDFVDISNLNRQILYREKHVGKKKVYSAKETINEFNSNVDFIPIDKKIESHLDILNILHQFKPDCVICVADKPPIKIYKWVNEACFANNIPFLYGGNSETTAFYQTVIPSISSCFLCYEKKLEKNINKDGYNKYLSIINNSYSTENNCTAASSSALAAFMLFDIVRLITKVEKPLSLNKRIFIDYKTNIVDEEPVEIQCDCEFCSNINYDWR